MLIEMQKVRKRYGQFELSCSLCLEEGRITGLIGQNGAGKSTMFKAILGLVKPDAGLIRVLGEEVQNMRPQIRSRIGVVLSDSSFGGHMTVKQAAAVLRNAYPDFSKEAFLKDCREHRLPLDKKIREFSTGMKAKMKVLTALSHDTKLLVLDEPTAGLDVTAREEILDMLRSYMEREGRGILISSHISSDLEGLCDDLYMIHEGKIIFYEETDVILSNYGILKLDEKQYRTIDQEHILCVKKEKYGYACLTKERRFYEENFPSAVVQKCGIDEVETMLIGGKKQ